MKHQILTRLATKQGQTVQEYLLENPATRLSTRQRLYWEPRVLKLVAQRIEEQR